ncbi:MAG: hypothetical protein KJ661_03785 [Candidatus Omnitrophica bacterium]|nr:hypothetical protein [Candidatus Omnitrophota bacterium]
MKYKHRLRDMLSEKLIRIAWYLTNMNLPERRALSYVNFCIHTEVIYEDGTYRALLKFSRDFKELTGKKITVCVSTPICPLVRKGLVDNGLSEKAFSERVSEMARHADVGYHGHYYPEGTTTFDHMRRSDYNKDLVVKQITREMTWFRNIGISPKTYIAGCWFMMKEMVLELERCGIEVDASIRRGKGDTFGGVYLDISRVPQYGRPFILPPSKNIVEIQSIFGPVMAPAIMKGHLSRYMRSDIGSVQSFIFPLHDWDIPRYYRNIWANVRELQRHKDKIAWANVNEMRGMYLNGKIV